MVTYHAVDSDACAVRVSEAWKALWAYMEASDASIRKASAQALDQLIKCFSPSFISAAVKERKKDEKKAPLSKIIAQVGKALGALTYARALAEVMTVISSLIAGLRSRGPTAASTGPTAAELLLMPIIMKVAELRVQKSFEFKEAADRTLSTAMQVLGPEVMLRELPLNLEPADRFVNSTSTAPAITHARTGKPARSPERSSFPCSTNLIAPPCRISCRILCPSQSVCSTCSRPRKPRVVSLRQKYGVSWWIKSGLVFTAIAMDAQT